MADDIIAPDDAFRRMLAARYGKAALKFAEEIRSYAWFWYPKSSHIKVRRGKIRKLAKIPLSVHAAAENVLKLLCSNVRQGNIRLRGELDNAPPIDIDRADCLVGELNIFEKTLTIFGRGGKPARIYQRMFCVKADVMKIVNSMSKNRSAPGPTTLEEAPEPTIRDVIRSVYDDADNNGGPRPNINDLPTTVLPRLAELGYRARSGNQIKEIGREREFVGRRGRVGKRLT